jgi:ribokinase
MSVNSPAAPAESAPSAPVGRVFVFGSINTDVVVYVQRVPRPGETVSGGTFATFPGGKGANQAVAAALAGRAVVEMHGCVGDDAFGRERLASLAATGVSTAGIRVAEGVHSGVAQITVDGEGENTIAVAPGANLRFTADAIPLPSPPQGECWVSMFQNEIPMAVTESLIARAAAAGHTVIWNIAPTIEGRPAAATLAAVDFLVCNRNELLALTGSAHDSAAAMEDLARIPLGWGVANLVVTLGREGSLWVSPAGIVRQAAFRVEAVDTVGAGDCFCGVFAAGLAEGLAPRAALRRASAAAAVSTTRRGAQTSMPRRDEIESFLAERS